MPSGVKAKRIGTFPPGGVAGPGGKEQLVAAYITGLPSSVVICDQDFLTRSFTLAGIGT